MVPRPLWYGMCANGHRYSDFDGEPYACPECGVECAAWMKCPHDLVADACECEEQFGLLAAGGALGNLTALAAYQPAAKSRSTDAAAARPARSRPRVAEQETRQSTLQRIRLVAFAGFFGPVVILGIVGLVMQGFEFFMKSETGASFHGVFKLFAWLALCFLCGRWAWKSSSTAR